MTKQEHMDFLESKFEDWMSKSERNSFLADATYLQGYAVCYYDVHENEHTICLADAFDLVDKVIYKHYPDYKIH